MRLPVDHSAMAVTGFVEPWSAPGGATRELALSVSRPVDDVRIRRLDRDGMPAMDWPVTELAQSGHQDFVRGSWMAVDSAGLARLRAISAIGFEVMLTRNEGRKVLLDAGAFSLGVEGTTLMLGERVLGRLPVQQWLEVKLDLSTGRIAVRSTGRSRPFVLEADAELGQPDGLTFCTDAAIGVPSLNCRLARIAVTGSDGEAEWVLPTRFTREALLSAGIGLTIAGNPTFCVTSARWDGSSLDPRLTPEHYDAIHFHDTDMAGLDWPANYAVKVPEDAETGVYAFEVVAGDAVERIAFFVTAKTPKAKLLFVLPTATYLAYADEYLPPHLYEWIGTDRGHEFARANNLRSLYDYHSDGSGVSLTTTRRPKATLRDDYNYPLCGDPHLLPVDLHFLKFAARMGIAVDVTTDHALHEAGLDLFTPYAGVITGSHPEYLSVRMEGAYRDYVAQGGKLAYLGGNGFAAAAAFDGDVMELRRGPTQPGRTWDGPLGEMALALTNEPGGYLRDRGLGEFTLTGVGIALMGFTKALPYTRAKASRGADFAWLFDGVENETFGDSGIVLGGAAGYEVDATSEHLGTPEGIVVLATARGFAPSYVDDAGRWHEGGLPQQEDRRVAEMTWLPHPSGGVVFSASSVCFLGTLPGPGAQNDVGRLTQNLLLHFSK